MTSAELSSELREIEDLAKKQRDGPYSAESDAMTALRLIERLASALIEHLNDKQQ